jgi:uncharacterized protein
VRRETISRPGGEVVCSCEIAERFLQRLVGLLGRRSLPAGEGLLIRPASSVHTFFMRFAIDVVFLDRNGVVVAIRPALPPWRTAFARGARSVLELGAGESVRVGLQVGEQLLGAWPRPTTTSNR